MPGESGADRIRSTETETYPAFGHDLLWADPDPVIPRILAVTDGHDPGPIPSAGAKPVTRMCARHRNDA